MNNFRNLVALFFIALSCITLNVQASDAVTQSPLMNTIVSEDSLVSLVVTADDTLTQQEFRREKLIAAILAFPVPFGFTGMHRIYLGSGPWVPVVYLCTGGGGFGLLPLIDFIFILKSDREEFEKYLSNPKLFMWVE
jgi:TM2 domain-containing membrane protein YozV